MDALIELLNFFCHISFPVLPSNPAIVPSVVAAARSGYVSSLITTAIGEANISLWLMLEFAFIQFNLP
jgi:hypothetical protein